MLGCVDPIIHFCLLGLCFICNELHGAYAIVHVLEPLKTSHQFLTFVNLHERESVLMILHPLMYALFFLSLFPLFLAFLKCWISCLGWLF